MKKVIDLNKLVQFLHEAHNNTYAASQGRLGTSSRSGSYDFYYTFCEWSYHDVYFGNERFIGSEIVYCAQQPVWGMNYYGGVTIPSIDTSLVYAFLKQALLVVPAESTDFLTIRGPREFSRDKFLYMNEIAGNYEWLNGTEQIFLDKNIIYRAQYHGGLIIGKEL